MSKKTKKRGGGDQVDPDLPDPQLLTKELLQRFDEIKEELARLREQVAALQLRTPTYVPYVPYVPYQPLTPSPFGPYPYTTWGDTTATTEIVIDQNGPFPTTTTWEGPWTA